MYTNTTVMSSTVKLTSSDDFTFEVSMATISQLKTVAELIEGLGGSTEQAIPLPNVNGAVLEKVLEWCKLHEGDDEELKEGPTKPIVLTDADETFFKVDDAMLFEIIAASNYLFVTLLLDQSCYVVARMMKDKTAEEIRTRFNIKSSFDAEEEKKLRKEFEWAEE